MTPHGTQAQTTEAPTTFIEFVRLLRDALRLVWDSGRQECIQVLLSQVVAMIVSMTVVVATGHLVSFFQGQAHHLDLRSIAGTSIAMAVLFGVSGLTTSMAGRQQQLLALLVQRRSSDVLLDVTTTVPVTKYDEPDWYDSLSRAQMGQGRPFQLLQGLVQVAHGLAYLIGSAAGLLFVAPLLLPLATIAFLPLGVASMSGGRQLYLALSRESRRDRQRDYLRHVLSHRDFAFEVRAYGVAGYLRNRHATLYDALISDVKNAVTAQGRRSIIALVFATVVLAGLLTLLAYLMSVGLVNLSQVAAGVMGLFILAAGVPAVSVGLSEVYETSLFVRDYHSFATLSYQHHERSASDDQKVPPLQDALRVEHVSFRYPAAADSALQDVSIEVRRGEMVAIVGVNGAGKTTLAKVAAGFYRPMEGRVCWDNLDYSQLEFSSLREQIAVIFQDFARYYLSVQENIGLGRVERMGQMEEIERAAQLSGLRKLIDSMPDRYDTILGSVFEDGYQLSGGEWQRVALARALFRDSSLLILDEPSASLDPRAEREFFEQVRAATKDRAVLLISHRLTSVLVADRIYVLDRGRVVESGTHHSLLQRGGPYAELFKLQTITTSRES
jgi:ATP-binding cassette subfamily B protein